MAIAKIRKQNIKVKAFANISGQLLLKIPYQSQRQTPVEKIKNMPIDKSSAD